MHSFEYRAQTLFCEDVDLQALAEKHGTPLYVYSGGTLRDHYRRLDAATAPQVVGGKKSCGGATIAVIESLHD